MFTTIDSVRANYFVFPGVTSLLRVKEPELMTESEQVKVYARTDFSDSDENMVSRLSEFIKESKKNLQRKSIFVDLGCGPGNITERLAANWPESTVVGIDGSVEMLKLAKERQSLVKKVSSLKGLTYLKQDISTLSSGQFNFPDFADVVVSNSFIHHIHDFNDFLNVLKVVSKEGTLFFHRDLRRPLTFDVALELQQKHLPTAHPIMIRDFLSSLKAAYTAEEVVDYLEKSNWKSYKVFEVGDRYLDILGIN